MEEAKNLQKRLSSSRPSLADRAKLLEVVRKHNLRCFSPLVAVHGSELLKRGASSLGDTVWTVWEQVLLAAIDTGNIALAELCLDKLQAKFPDSRRVKRLLGMLCEAKGNFVEAMAVYKAICQTDPADEVARQRVACIARGQGDLAKATQLIIVHIRDFQGDVSSWKMLVDLYLQQNLHQQAKFCIEELILVEPHNHVWHTLYAEVLYTLGSHEDLRLARKHYSRSLSLCASETHPNMRALYGLLAVTSALKSKSDTPEDKENTQLFKLASTKLISSYLNVGNPSHSGHAHQLVLTLKE